MRAEKFAENEKEKKERLDQIKEKKTIGTEVPMASFITEISSGRDLTDIYLKHPANESSEDEDGTEDTVVANGDDEKEEESFNKFIEEHKTKTENKVKVNQIQENP